MKINDKSWKVNVIMTFDIPISKQGTQLHYDVDVPENVMTDKDLFVEYLCKKIFRLKDWMKHLWKISCSTNISEIIESNSELGSHFKRWYMLTNGKFFRDFGDFDRLRMEWK
tara:strand:+ start:2711 stop:3046 length:336 start_codon:yes stop_codon:yes gene_type:complete